MYAFIYIYIYYLYIGVSQAIITEANNRIKSNTNIYKDLNALLNTLGFKELKLAPTIFPKSSLSWIGGSLFASIPVYIIYIYILYIYNINHLYHGLVDHYLHLYIYI